MVRDEVVEGRRFLQRVKSFALRYGTTIMMVSLIIAFSMMSPIFFSFMTFLDALVNMTVSGIVALGLTFVVASGRWDLSFGRVATFVAIIVCALLSIAPTWATIPLIALGIGAGVLIGWVNGLLVGRYRFNDMLCTLAVSSLVFGLGYIPTGGLHIYKNFGSQFVFLFNGHIGSVPFASVLLLLTYVAGYVVLHKSSFGRSVYAVGGNERASWFSGIDVSKVRIWVYILCAALAAFGGMLQASHDRTAWVLMGERYLLRDFAAVFLGWSIMGKPCVVGTFFGALFLSLLRIGFVLIEAPYALSDVMTGVVLILAIAVGAERSKRQGTI
jgi:ribose transport system permease protein